MRTIDIPPALDVQTRLQQVEDLHTFLDQNARLLVVADLGALHACDDPIRDIARAAMFTDFAPNPTVEQGRAAAALARETRADVILAFGGGSCIDVAKFAAATARNEVDDRHLTDLPDDLDAIPIIAIPTTSGTGSETTHFAAIYRDGVKCSVAHHALRPENCVLDAKLHLRMPPHLAACSGIDALCQAFESGWAVASTDDSITCADDATSRLVAHLVRSVTDPTLDAREEVMLGAHLAGLAINVSKTTAAHAISYQLTTRYGIPHGHAVALTVGHLARANHATTDDDCIDPRGPAHVRQRANAAATALDTTPDEMPLAMTRLLEDLGLAPTLGEAGAREEDLPDIAARVDPVRLSNNPRRLTRDALESLLRDAF